MGIQTLNVGAAPGDGTGDTLRGSQTKVNSNFSVSENAASKIVQASSADTTADKVMMSDYAWRSAQLGDYFTYGGTANAITLTSANLAAGGTLIAGMKFRFKATAANTGATTIAVDGGAVTSCVTPTGVALPSGFIRTDVFTECEYDGANFVVSRKVESGSNASGEWTRWEDGSATIFRTVNAGGTTTTQNSLFISGLSTPSFPITFSSIPVVQISGTNVNEMAMKAGGSTVSTCSVYAVRTFTSATNAFVSITATGKWY